MSLIFAILLASTCQTNASIKTCTKCELFINQKEFVKVENNGSHIYKKMPTMWIKLSKRTKNSN